MAALIKQAIFNLSRLTISGHGIHTAATPLLFRATPVSCAEPLKKKKRLDPTLLMAREQKKRRRIEKQIRRLERVGRKLKPIDELFPDYKLRRETEMRQRPSSALPLEEDESRALLKKDWTRYKYYQFKVEAGKILQAEKCMAEALTELRAESEELYQMAIQPDPDFIPYDRSGPVRTPPIPGYDAPDGDFTDTTKQF